MMGAQIVVLLQGERLCVNVEFNIDARRYGQRGVSGSSYCSSLDGVHISITEAKNINLIVIFSGVYDN